MRQCDRASRRVGQRLLAVMNVDHDQLVQAHDDREAVQVSPDELVVIDIHSLQPAAKPRERPTGTRSTPTREKRHRRGEATRFGNAFWGQEERANCS